MVRIDRIDHRDAIDTPVASYELIPPIDWQLGQDLLLDLEHCIYAMFSGDYLVSYGRFNLIKPHY
ncbi:MAG TPA: hypothetical protein VMW64_00880 [Dehalococcoidia bacterium]|nr:hypothetical protein [Dehalococcoidia bacterium]